MASAKEPRRLAGHARRRITTVPSAPFGILISRHSELTPQAPRRPHVVILFWSAKLLYGKTEIDDRFCNADSLLSWRLGDRAEGGRPTRRWRGATGSCV